MSQEKRPEHRNYSEEYAVSPQTSAQQIDAADYPVDNALSTLEFKEAALLAYEQAIQLAPREAELHYHKGQALEQLGRLAEARRSYDEARRLGYKQPSWQ